MKIFFKCLLAVCLLIASFSCKTKKSPPCSYRIIDRYACMNGKFHVAETGSCSDNFKNTDVVMSKESYSMPITNSRGQKGDFVFLPGQYYYMKDVRNINNSYPLIEKLVCYDGPKIHTPVAIRNPNETCSSRFQYRTEDVPCTIFAGEDNLQWAAGNDCNTYYYDTDPNNKDVNGRVLHISVRTRSKSINNTIHWGIATFKNNQIGSVELNLFYRYAPSHPNVLDFEMLYHNNAQLVQHNGDGTSDYLWNLGVPFRDSQTSSAAYYSEPRTITLYPVLMEFSPKHSDDKNQTYAPVGMHCPITLSNRYTAGGMTFSKRELNIISLKNKGEVNFKSDISTYLRGTKSFKDLCQATFGDKINCRISLNPKDPVTSASTTGLTLPANILDSDGNAVLFESDFGAAAGQAIDFTNFNSTVFKNTVLKNWYKRLLNSVRMGLDEQKWNPTVADFYQDGNIDGALKDGISAVYRNFIPVVAINGFKICKKTDVSVAETSNTTFQTYIDKVESTLPYELKFYDNLPSGKTLIREPLDPLMSVSDVMKNYTPVCVVFGQPISKQFTAATATADISGDMIGTALHEMLHAWYAHGGCEFDKLEEKETEAHNAYVFDKNKSITDVCLMRASPSLKPSEIVTWRKKRNNSLLISEGVAERLRNILSATYKK